MPESTKVHGIGAYANLCLTVIAGCLIYLCYRTTTMDVTPTQVEIVRIASGLNTPMPCKIMYRNQSTYSTHWVDEGTLRVQFAGGEELQNRMQVEIVGVASHIQNRLPVTTKTNEKVGPYGNDISSHDPIAVRLVGIERPGGFDAWDAIPARLTEINKGTPWNPIPARLIEINKGYGKAWDPIPVQGEHGMPVRMYDVYRMASPD